MRRSAATIDTKMESALDFLRDPRALEGKMKSKTKKLFIYEI